MKVVKTSGVLFAVAQRKLTKKMWSGLVSLCSTGSWPSSVTGNWNPWPQTNAWTPSHPYVMARNRRPSVIATLSS